MKNDMTFAAVNTQASQIGFCTVQQTVSHGVATKTARAR